MGSMAIGGDMPCDIPSRRCGRYSEVSTAAAQEIACRRAQGERPPRQANCVCRSSAAKVGTGPLRVGNCQSRLLRQGLGVKKPDTLRPQVV
jgi:hypothetical protein